MPRGGRRPGAGRPRGSGRRAADKIREQVTEFLKSNAVAIFEGDSLALAISVYKNENLPLGLRMHAASLALPFERPRLQASVAVTRHLGEGDERFARLFAEIEARLARAPERRLEVIEALRADEDA